MDANTSNLKRKISDLYRNSGTKQKLKSRFYKKVYKSIDLISTETEETFSLLHDDDFFSGLNIQKIPNGLENLPLYEKLPAKEHMIISVARFGTVQKNTELLLTALSEVILNDWKVYLIGSVEKDFETYIESFFSEHPSLREKIFFVGEISDKETLCSYYARARVFLLPSRYEGFAIAPLEAASFLDYLILSDTGAAKDLIPEDSFGYILPESRLNSQNEKVMQYALIKKLNRIISGTDKTNNDIDKRKDFVTKFLMKNIVKMNCFSEWISQ